jgi:hypothetical protein
MKPSRCLSIEDSDIEAEFVELAGKAGGKASTIEVISSPLLHAPLAQGYGENPDAGRES